MNARGFNILGLVLVGVIGLTFMILTPRLAELDTVLDLTVYMIMAVLAPVSGVFPTIGVAYVAKSFITVIGGGAAILSGTVSASALFGTINQIATFVTTPVFGEVALLAAAIVLIRLLPQGITGRFFRRGL